MKKVLLCLLSLVILASCGVKQEAAKVAGTCNIIISCENTLDNMDDLSDDVIEFIPEKGIILELKDINYYENETAFDLLNRICKENKIKMQFESNPGLDSKYVTEINNLKSGDAGEMSGWIYYINDESSQIAADDYIIKNNDVIKWYYVCDMSSLF